MNNIDVFEMEKDVHRVLHEVSDKSDLAKEYKSMCSKVIEMDLCTKAILDAVESVLPAQEKNEVANLMMEKIFEHKWRGVTAEERAILERHGINYPLILLQEDDALYCFEHNEQVFLLHGEGNRTVPVTKEELLGHMNAGGIVGISSYTFDQLKRRSEEDAIED